MESSPPSSTPRRLLDRLDRIAASLASRPDALALLALGSVGLETTRLDDHSDLDFFVVVREGAKAGYLESIGWLEAAAPVAFSFPNTSDGRKVLFEDDVYAEYAVFEPRELASIPFPPGRLVWRREGVPDDIAAPRLPPPREENDLDWQVGEALTNLLVGLHRDARGETLAGARLIQIFAVDRVLRIAAVVTEPVAGLEDAFAVERRAERRLPGLAAHLPEMVGGYGRNRESARAVLDWLEAHVRVDGAMARAVRALLDNRDAD